MFIANSTPRRESFSSSMGSLSGPSAAALRAAQLSKKDARSFRYCGYRFWNRASASGVGASSSSISSSKTSCQQIRGLVMFRLPFQCSLYRLPRSLETVSHALPPHSDTFRHGFLGGIVARDRHSFSEMESDDLPIFRIFRGLADLPELRGASHIFFFLEEGRLRTGPMLRQPFQRALGPFQFGILVIGEWNVFAAQFTEWRPLA